MSSKNRLAACAAFVCLACTSLTAIADEHAYSEGAVVNMSRIRTADGKLDEYMKWIDTSWKQYQELGIKAGDVISYQVLLVEPRSPDDPDIILIVTYKNWASLDGSIAKNDAIAKQVEGSVSASNQSMADRGSMRRVLGSETMQELKLK